MAEQKRTRARKRRRPEEEERFSSVLDIYEDVKESFKSLFPPEFVEHMSNAGRENLLAIRSIIDNALERIEREIERTER